MVIISPNVSVFLEIDDTTFLFFISEQSEAMPTTCFVLTLQNATQSRGNKINKIKQPACFDFAISWNYYFLKITNNSTSQWNWNRRRFVMPQQSTSKLPFISRGTLSKPLFKSKQITRWNEGGSISGPSIYKIFVLQWLLWNVVEAKFLRCLYDTFQNHSCNIKTFFREEL